MLRILLVWGLMLGCLIHAHPQNFLSWKYNDRYFSAQAGIGFSSYRGELQHTNSFQNNLANLNLAMEARLLSKIAARVEVSRYTLKGDDKNAPDSSYARQRNLSFQSANWELTIMGIFYMREYRGDYHKRWEVDPYLLAGFGTTFISPTAKLAGQEYDLYNFQTESRDYNRWTMVFPVGAGLKLRINQFLNVIGEFSYRFTLSDYLDDVSTTYPENFNELNFTTQLLSNRKDELEGIVNQDAYDNVLIPGGRRGNPSNKDAYMFLNLKLELFLPPGLFRSKKDKNVVKKPSAH